MGLDGFQRRITIIGSCFIVVAMLASVRLFYLQVIKHNYYKTLASSEQRRKYEVPSNRGKIYMTDRGQKLPVVLNRDLKTLYGDPRYITDKSDTAKRLAEVTKDDAKKYEEALGSADFYVVLKKQVEPAMAEAINDLELAGVGLNDSPVRVYPEGALGAQVLGFVNNDGNGQYGMEEYFNNQLAGSKGLLNAKTDTRGIPIATSDNLQLRPIDGTDVVLTLDRNIQAKVEQVLQEGTLKYKAKNASAVVMDPKNGKILAMANFPTYDPAKYQEVEDYNVFSNRVATGLYEPGSIMKVFAMGAGLESKAVTPETPFANTGSTQVSDYTIKNAQTINSGNYTMAEVLSHSINTGMVEVLRYLGGGQINSAGKQKLYDFYTGRFKFGEPTGAQIPAEPSGTIYPPTENDVTYANMSFGQGMTATMLQLASAYGALANGGTIYKPQLVEQTIGTNGQVENYKPEVRQSAVLGTQSIAQVTSMMQAVIDRAVGIGVKLPGYALAGKTGTAQIPDPKGGYYENRDIGSFAGFGPVNNPEYVVIVRTDEPQAGITQFAGSGAAGPMWGNIMQWLLNYGGVAPSG